jgi:hypothetical protein
VIAEIRDNRLQQSLLILSRRSAASATCHFDRTLSETRERHKVSHWDCPQKDAITIEWHIAAVAIDRDHLILVLDQSRRLSQFVGLFPDVLNETAWNKRGPSRQNTRGIPVVLVNRETVAETFRLRVETKVYQRGLVSLNKRESRIVDAPLPIRRRPIDVLTVNVYPPRLRPALRVPLVRGDK